MTYKGKYQPKNPKKYLGDSSNIVYRSGWELQCMNYFDRNENIIEWGSEEIVIPYRSPIDGRIHRYFTDFIIRARTKSGKIETTIIEVKPHSQTKPPEVKKRKTKRYIKEVVTYVTNEAKWNAAEEYCHDRKWKFKILTEYDLGIKNK
jgi:hypothetical protein